jgi:hypothetical protein
MHYISHTEDLQKMLSKYPATFDSQWEEADKTNANYLASRSFFHLINHLKNFGNKIDAIFNSKTNIQNNKNMHASLTIGEFKFIERKIKKLK